MEVVDAAEAQNSQDQAELVANLIIPFTPNEDSDSEEEEIDEDEWIISGDEDMFQIQDDWVLHSFPTEYRDEGERALRKLWNMVRWDTDIVILDTETTGLTPNHEIIALTALKINTKGEMSILDFKCCPRQSIPPDATAVHGITNEDVKNCPPFWQFVPLLCKFIGNCDLIGFNIMFDINMIDYEMRNYVDTIGAFSGGGVGQALYVGSIYDIGKPYWDAVPKTDIKRSLSKCYLEYVGRSMTNAHSSMGDVMACLSILPNQLRLHFQKVRTWGQLKAQYFATYDLDPFLELTKVKDVIVFDRRDYTTIYVWPATRPEYWMVALLETPVEAWSQIYKKSDGVPLDRLRKILESEPWRSNRLIDRHTNIHLQG